MSKPDDYYDEDVVAARYAEEDARLEAYWRQSERISSLAWVAFIVAIGVAVLVLA